MITAHSLTKRYGEATAVDDLTFEVPSGEVTGFLGPNGSGKSTTMRMIMGLDLPDSGSALINGKRYNELDWPLREVGALLDAKAFHPARTARNHLRWLALANDIPVGRVDEVLDQVGLTSVAGRRVGKFSLGMTQRLGIAAALLGDPGVLLFDEPVNGLDPEGIRWVRHFLRDLSRQGRTVLVSSHLISEMALTADRLVVIGRGRLIAETSVADFVTRSGGGAVRLVTPDMETFTASLTEAGGTVVGRGRGADGRRADFPPDRGPGRPGRAPDLRTDSGDRVPGGRVHGADPGRGGVPPVDDAWRTGRGTRSRTMTTQILLDDPRGHYRPKHIARSELAKIVTLRSTALTVGLTVAACLLVTALVTHEALHHDPRFYQGFDPTQESLAGMITVALAGGVFGALLITGEYSSGTIRSTLAAAPKRSQLLATKLGVTTGLSMAFCVVLSFVSFFLGQAILSSGGAPTATLASPGAARAVVLTGLFVGLLALMAFGFGLIFRSTAAAIAGFVAVIFVLPLVMHSISEAAVRYLPTNILLSSIMSTVPQGQSGPFPPLAPVVGLMLMVLYAAAMLAVGAVLFVRRDA